MVITACHRRYVHWTPPPAILWTIPTAMPPADALLPRTVQQSDSITTPAAYTCSAGAPNSLPDCAMATGFWVFALGGGCTIPGTAVILNSHRYCC